MPMQKYGKHFTGFCHENQLAILLIVCNSTLSWMYFGIKFKSYNIIITPNVTVEFNIFMRKLFIN